MMDTRESSVQDVFSGNVGNGTMSNVFDYGMVDDICNIFFVVLIVLLE